MIYLSLFQRHGVGTWKSADGSLVYEGQWEANKKHGKGKVRTRLPYRLFLHREIVFLLSLSVHLPSSVLSLPG